MVHSLLSLLLLSTLAAPAPPVEPSWIELKAAGGKAAVVTDAGEKAGRKVAMQIAQFDRGVQKRFVWLKTGEETPLVVFASADEATVRSMASDASDTEGETSRSSYLVGAARHVGALQANLPDPSDKERSPYRDYYKGRAAYLIEKALGKTAPWLSRGLVAFLADTVVKDKEILIGRMAGVDVEKAGPPATAAEFFRENRTADRKLDAQAGLFVHFLMAGEGGKNASALDALLSKLAASDPPASVQPALARVTALYAAFPKYLAAKKFAPLKIPADPSITPAALAVRPLPPVEALMLRAEALFELNRPVDARGLLRQVRAKDPTLARPLEIEAVLYEREQRSAEAKQAIEAAIQLGSKNGALYYRLAQLQWARVMPKAALLAVQKNLETARDFAPDDPKVLSYLAETQSDLGLTQNALESARRGAASRPQDVYAQMALARALWNARQADPALATARQAFGLAKIPSEKQRVQDFITFATRYKRAQASGGKPYLTQFGPPPEGAFGVTRSAGNDAGGRVNVGQVQMGSADASAVAACFAKRDDAACARAVPALESACGEKQATSCVSLGSLYDGGFGVQRDVRKAAASYKTACDLGDKPGCARFSVLEAQGLGAPRNSVRARKTLESLCAERLPEACVGLGLLLRQTGIATDRARAQGLLKAACADGSTEACGLLASR